MFWIKRCLIAVSIDLLNAEDRNYLVFSIERSHYSDNVTYPRYLFRHSASHNGPRLALAQSYWALRGRDVSIEDSLARYCKFGFEFLEAGLREDRMTPLRTILRTLPLALIAQGWATTIQEASIFFERAVELNAVAMNLHLGHAYLDDAECERLVDEAYALAEANRLPLMLETHRGRATQDLYRTSTLIQRRPDTRIVLDVSHYLVAGETVGGDPALFDSSLEPLLQVTEMIHGRVSNGQQIQVSIADEGAVALTKSIWERAMTAWLADAPPDAVLVFEPELGPPPYAYLAKEGETYSRDAETDGLIRIARDAWDAAQKRGAA